mmetsp:Transcript_9207/g.19851  ORF Transcript_9207/g.19851 Transcript_9207/m.19851 type:complete len:88 (+) Transcript_9207:440-703(+)
MCRTSNKTSRSRNEAPDESEDRHWLPNFTNNLTSDDMKFFLLTEEEFDMPTENNVVGTRNVPTVSGFRIPKANISTHSPTLIMSQQF